MELDNIERLLEKYFEAKTTVAEEKVLRAYFSQEKVAAHLEVYRPMFGYFSQGKTEQFTKELPLKETSKGLFRRLYPWLSVAAVTVLMIGVYFGKKRYDQQQLEKEKAQYAYQETKKALSLLADNFSRGTEKVAYLNEFVEAKEKIYNKN
ncbi:hypothetical protein [Pseudozobellia thermophila]|uniref:Uncharacterized protein n=1 Tax=Pseudozobellia thermophila TaxID=192903 RepID=A0A1M6FFD7_9FLAO|nr:hypothetical protein [Pseudozobellia thermophila]SHI96431.1 hypothetical protein SAMN04488513_102412 [Pseudozobellia thermophila]